MREPYMSFQQPEVENFIEVRCKICNHFLFEAEENSVGKIRQKCKKCKRTAKIRLSPELKKNSIYQAVAEQSVAFA